MFARLLLCASLVVVSAACSRSKSTAAASTGTPVKIRSATADGMVTIDRAQLGQELVWSTWLERVDSSLYPGLQPGFPGLSQLVYLELSQDGKTVHLFEKKENAQDPRGAKLIDRFPVTTSNAAELTFDFAQGLNRRFFKSFIQPDGQFRFQYSYTSVYGFENRNGVATFSQLMKLNDQKGSTLIVHHALRAFNDRSGFQTLKVSRPDQLGLMPAVFTDGPKTDEPVAIRRWDIRQPIVMYVSSNTPVIYRDAIARGLRWWNEAFGSEVIKVEFLTAPVSWGEARINILQWSDDPTFCGGAAAIGPSEANPVTGQIYSGKILFCGSSFAPLFDDGIEIGTIGREPFMQKAMTYGAAHEMGHVLGFSHNFRGKLFRDPAHSEVLTSTVMDYPVAAELAKYTKVGPADEGKIAVSYLKPGDAAAVAALRAFPICLDEEAATAPDCTRFVPGGLTVEQLAERYLGLLRSGKPVLKTEHAARIVIIKQLFSVGDAQAVAWMKELFEIYPGNKNLLVDEVAATAEAGRAPFALLTWDRQAEVLDMLAESTLSPSAGLSLAARKVMIKSIAGFQTVGAQEALFQTRAGLESLLVNETDPAKLGDLHKLQIYLEKVIEAFWQSV